MDKANHMSNEEYLKWTLENMKISISFNLNKITEVSTLLSNATRGVLEPVRRISSIYSKKIGAAKKTYEEALKKIESKKEMIEGYSQSSKEEININLITEENKCNAALSNDYSKLVDMFSKIVSIISAFNELFESSQYSKLVDTFHELADKNDPCNEDTKSINSEKSEKNNILKKKKKRNLLKTKLKRSEFKAKKQQEDEESIEKKRSKKLSDDEVVERTKKQFPDYKGLNKTFLTRRLKKKIIFIGECDYTASDVKFSKNEFGKSGLSYDYVKFTLSLNNPSYNSDFTNLLKSFLNYHVVKIEPQDNKIIIAGDIKGKYEDFATQFETTELKKKFGLMNAKIEIFMFLEEMFSDFEFKNDKNFFHNLTNEKITSYKKEYEELMQIRKVYEELKLVKVSDK